MNTLNMASVATIIPPLLLIESFFAGAEISLMSVDRLTLKRQAKQGMFGAELALGLVTRPESILSTTLLMTNLCMIGISCVISLYFAQIFGTNGKAELIAVLTTSPLIVILGELLPKTIFQRHANSIARWVAYPVSIAFWVFFPLTRVLSSYTTRLSRLVGPIEEMLTGRRRTTREEIRALLAYTRSETEIKSAEKRMIKRIFDFKDSEAKHALIPLVRVEAIEEASTVKQALERFEAHRHSRMPVYSGRIDNITGVLEVTDLLGANDFNQSIRHYLTSAHYVSETQSLDDLLQEMRTEDCEMVVVVDEHGGAVGVLTFEDIVEEIVGEIADEYDHESLPYKEVAPESWLVQARMEIQAINDLLKLDVPQGEYETLSGFLLQQFGRIPQVRDELYFDTSAGTLKFVIRKATSRHIETVLVERIAPKSPGS